jgi:hypothetical protein
MSKFEIYFSNLLNFCLYVMFVSQIGLKILCIYVYNERMRTVRFSTAGVIVYSNIKVSRYSTNSWCWYVEYESPYVTRSYFARLTTA